MTAAAFRAGTTTATAGSPSGTSAAVMDGFRRVQDVLRHLEHVALGLDRERVELLDVVEAGGAHHRPPAGLVGEPEHHVLVPIPVVPRQREGEAREALVVLLADDERAAAQVRDPLEG